MPSPTRLKRISDRIKQEIAEMLVLGKINDPRLSSVSITDVNVDRELSYANIFVSAVEGHIREAEIMQGLESARGFLRKQLSERIELRSFPQLRFHWDPTPEKADRIEQLLDKIKALEVKGKHK
jgi:ribosome-binding factor A